MCVGQYTIEMGAQKGARENVDTFLQGSDCSLANGRGDLFVVAKYWRKFVDLSGLKGGVFSGWGGGGHWVPNGTLHGPRLPNCNRQEHPQRLWSHSSINGSKCQPAPPRYPHPRSQGCIKKEGTSKAVGGGERGGWRRLPKRLGAVTVGYKCH